MESRKLEVSRKSRLHANGNFYRLNKIVSLYITICYKIRNAFFNTIFSNIHTNIPGMDIFPILAVNHCKIMSYKLMFER